MLNKRHFKAFAALALASALLTGCSESNALDFNPNAAPDAAAADSANDPQNETQGEAPDESQTESAGVSQQPLANTEVHDELPEPTVISEPKPAVFSSVVLPANTPSEVQLLKLTPHRWASDFAETAFLSDIGYDHITEYVPGEWDVDHLHTVYVNSFDHLLAGSCCPGNISFDSDDSYTYHYATIRSYCEVYNASNEFFNDYEISGMSRAEAVAKAEEMLATLGITNYGEPEIWAITADKANAYLYAEGPWYEKDGTEYDPTRWTSDNEAYLITYPFAYNGIPATVTGSAGAESSFRFEDSYINFTVTKSGIAEVSGFNVLDNEAEVIGTATISVSAEEALEKVKNNYIAQNRAEAVEIQSCTLQYGIDHDWVNETFVLRPIWVFRSIVENEFGDYSVVKIDSVDAVTGEAKYHDGAVKSFYYDDLLR